MDPEFLEEVVGTLFPGAVNEEQGRANQEQELQLSEEEPQDTTGCWSPESAVTKEESPGSRRSLRPPVERDRRGLAPEAEISV
jgi:hypothetical protein